MSAAGSALRRHLRGWLSRRRSVAVNPESASGVLDPAVRDRLVERIVMAMPDPVIVLDRGGLVVAHNASAREIAPALGRGQPAAVALRMPELLDAIRAAAEAGTPQRVEFSMPGPARRWLEAVVTPAGDGADGLLVAAVHDLTPLRRAETMRSEFVANVSHELRTPLAALTGFIDTLQGAARDDTAARERFLGIMQAQAWRVARLIDDLQTLARDRGVEVTTVHADRPMIVLGDRDELIRLFENLVENGLKYGASGKRLDIVMDCATAGERPEARVSVRDYGIGIAPEHLPRLTERFYRVDVGESRSQGGTGLGLALVKHILVKHILIRHQGSLAIESKLGEGATFTVRLPLA